MAQTKVYSARIPQDVVTAYRNYGNGSLSAGILRLGREKFRVPGAMGEPYFAALAREKATKSGKSKKKTASKVVGN